MKTKYITQKELEEFLDVEISDFKMEPVYQDGICRGLQVTCKQKTLPEYINLEIKITKS
jgi:hypothetical protein